MLAAMTVGHPPRPLFNRPSRSLKATPGTAAGLHNGFALKVEADTFKLPKVEG